MIKTILEIDLKGYSGIARELEEHFSAELFMKFNDQIQAFVTDGLKAAGVSPKDAVMATTGDGAILVFDTPSAAHIFAEAVHKATRDHNQQKTVPTAKRWFRIGIATGDLAIEETGGKKKMAGSVIARAVRLEAAANIGEILTDADTYAGFLPEQQDCYGAEEYITGKREESFGARRYTVVKDIPVSRESKISKGRILFFSFTLLLMGIVSFVSWQRFHVNRIPEKPSISLEIGQVINPKDPYQTILTVHNPNNETVSNVSVIAFWYDSENPSRRLIRSSTPDLGSDFIPGKRGQGFSFANAHKGFPELGQRTFVGVYINYTLGSSTNMVGQNFGFCISRTAEGSYYWVPAGEITTEMINKKIRALPSGEYDAIPFIDLMVNSIEDLSQTNKAYPLRLNYTWGNGGGTAATNVYIEWYALDLASDAFVIWPNNWPAAAAKEVILPNVFYQTSNYYSDSSAPFVFNAIKSGNFKLFGLVSFQDLDKREYGMHVQAVPTSSGFQMIYMDFADHFKNISNSRYNFK